MNAPSDNRVTIYDVAREAGTSIGTVSRVLNDRKHVAAATKTRVLEAATKLGFTPMLAAPRVCIGFVTQEISKAHEVGYAGAVLSALTNHASRRGVSLEILPLHDIGNATARHVHGLIGLLFGKAADDLARVRHMPVVLLNNLAGPEHCHVVATDHAQGTQLGTRHLIERGHTRIALLQVAADDWGSREREKGYREAFREAGLAAPKDLVACLEDNSVERVLKPLLARGPTALIASGEDLSLAIIDVLSRGLGVRVPDDLSVITYEVPIVSSLVAPPQTTIAQPWEELSYKAIETMLAVLKRGNAGPPVRIILPNELLSRASVKRVK
jgi:LacI family transcriptional regulator